MNLEGYCTNDNFGGSGTPCTAYKKLVVMKYGYGEFDLYDDSYENNPRLVCPMCEKYVKPITILFVGCIYIWKGRKRELKDDEIYAPSGELAKPQRVFTLKDYTLCR